MQNECVIQQGIEGTMCASAIGNCEPRDGLCKIASHTRDAVNFVQVGFLQRLDHPYIVGYKDSWIGLREMPGLLGATRASAAPPLVGDSSDEAPPRHPARAPCAAPAEKGHTVCIVCVFAEGGDLTNQLRRRCRDMKHFSEQHLKEWATQMLLVGPPSLPLPLPLPHHLQ